MQMDDKFSHQQATENSVDYVWSIRVMLSMLLIAIGISNISKHINNASLGKLCMDALKFYTIVQLNTDNSRHIL